MGGGSTGRTSPTAQQRVNVEWKTLRFAEFTSEGYAESSRPFEDMVADAVKREISGKKPVLVLVVDDADEKTNKALESALFTDEKICLALKRFTCLRGELRTLPEGREFDKLKGQVPIVRFYDPSGALFDELSGKRASSRSGFTARVERLWDQSYEVSLKDYSRDMGDLLDRMDKLEGEKTRLADQLGRAADNPRKLASLQKEEEALKKAEEALLEEERQILAGVTLKTAWLGAGESAKK